jgi:ATP synthase protein I
MNPTRDEHELRSSVERDAGRLKKAAAEREQLLVQTIYLTTLGLVFVLPLVAGAYLGHWLDGLSAGYSIRWTLSLLFLGLVLGAFNVYFLIRRND